MTDPSPFDPAIQSVTTIDPTEAADPANLAPIELATAIDPLRRGDLARIRVDGVNLRSWMAKTAPVRRKLRAGQRCAVLSDRYLVNDHPWFKVRLQESDLTGYVAAPYLELVEAGFDAALSVDLESETPDSIGAGYQTGDYLTSGASLNIRSGPGILHDVVAKSGANMLGIVLDEPTVVDSQVWVPVRFASGSGWIAAINARFLARTGKWIEVDLIQQQLLARLDAVTVASSPISSGKPGHPTPHGVFEISTKIPTRRLRGDVRGASWDIPGVPWIMIFRHGGFYIHAAFWHEDFGQPVSHGCVTVPVDFAEWLYEWTPLHTPIWIHW
jgi:hypothetical protein